METQSLIFAVCTSAAGVIAGWIFKKSPIPNGFIPGVMGVLAVGCLVWLTDLSFKAAVLAAMGVVGGAVTIYETGNAVKKATNATGGGGTGGVS